MEELQTHIPEFSGLTGLLVFVVGVAVRSWLKDRREAKERADRIFMQCVRQAYNSVENKLKVGHSVEDKAQAGLLELDRFMRYRLRRPATQEEREHALLEFEALHGELCPGGAPAEPG